MKRFLVPVVLLVLAACSQPNDLAEPTLESQFGTAGYDAASDVAVRGSSIYVVGAGDANPFTRRYSTSGSLLSEVKSGSAGFDMTRSVAIGGDFVYSATQYESSSTGTDSVVSKTRYDSGYSTWRRYIASSGSDTVYGVAADSAGNVYATGFTTGALTGSNRGSLDAFIRKYNASGAVLWTRQFGTSGVDTTNGLALDSYGNAYVVGYTYGALAGTNQGGHDAFIRKYSAAGGVLWTRQFQLGGNDEAYDVAVRGTSEVYVVGTFDYSASDQDGFVRKYDGLGNMRWTKPFGGSRGELVDGVSVDPLGNVYVAGATSSSLDGINQGSYDAFVRKYSGSGTLTWGKQFGTSGSDYAEKIATPSETELYVVGRSSGPLAGSNSGSTDAFIRRMNGAGEPVWTR